VLADERTGLGLLGVRLGLELYEVNVFMATNEVLKLPTCSFDIVVYGNIKGYFIKTLNCLNLLKCIMILPCEIDNFVELTLVDLYFSYFHCCGIQYCGPPSLNRFFFVFYYKVGRHFISTCFSNELDVSHVINHNKLLIF
jgi:hypothetical protein